MNIIKYHPNYATNKKHIQLKIDETFAERTIPANDSVSFLDESMEEIDYSPLFAIYNRIGRPFATSPVTLMKILVYSNMQGIYSSRAIASSCRRDMNYIWLLNGESAPNHSEIASFRSKRLSVCGEELFYQLVEKLTARAQKYECYQKTFKGRNSFSKTDPDATFMHMKDDHMRNAQLRPGYNIQLGVEGEYISGVSISSERSDQLALIPLLENMQKYLKKSYKDVSADAGYESEVTYYECESCEGCEYKKSCTRSKNNRKMQVSKKFVRQRSETLERIKSEEGILLRVNRSIQVEGAFGVIKQNYGLRRFLLRGSQKVLTEMLLLAMGYNINKLHNKIQQNRTGTQLFEKSIS